MRLRTLSVLLVGATVAAVVVSTQAVVHARLEIKLTQRDQPQTSVPRIIDVPFVEKVS